VLLALLLFLPHLSALPFFDIEGRIAYRAENGAPATVRHEEKCWRAVGEGAFAV
jgi:hypothetical protein